MKSAQDALEKQTPLERGFEATNLLVGVGSTMCMIFSVFALAAAIASSSPMQKDEFAKTGFHTALMGVAGFGVLIVVRCLPDMISGIFDDD